MTKHRHPKEIAREIRASKMRPAGRAWFVDVEGREPSIWLLFEERMFADRVLEAGGPPAKVRRVEVFVREVSDGN